MFLFGPGDRIGKYRVVRRLSRGGMGALYLADDPDAIRPVVVKVMLDGDPDPAVRLRFIREGQAAAALRHTNVVTVYEVGEHDGRPFITLEYVSGATLRDVIERKMTLTLDRKLEILEQVCAGLHAAHRAGIVHRDIKPANIMLDDLGVVRILDFGIARTSGSAMTGDGDVIGTLNYMSPEQMAGQPVDQRSDVFSVGAVAYELITLRQAFRGNVLDGVGHRIQAVEPEPITAVCPGIDSDIQHVVARGLHKDPAGRYETIAQMQDDLARIRLRSANPHTLVIAGRHPGQSVPPAPIEPTLARTDRTWRFPTPSAVQPRLRWAIGLALASAVVVATAALWPAPVERSNDSQSEQMGDASVQEQIPAREAAGRAASRASANSPATASRVAKTTERREAVRVADEDASDKALAVERAREISRQSPLEAVRSLDPLLSGPNAYPPAVAAARDFLREADGNVAEEQAAAVAAHAPQLVEEEYALAEEAWADARDAEATARYAVAYELKEKAASHFRRARTAAAAAGAAGSADVDVGSEREIRDVIRQYEAAYAALSGAAVKRVAPGLSAAEVSALDRAFVDARAYEVRLENVRVARSGGEARVTGVALHRIEQKSGEVRNVTASVELGLQRGPAGWTITRVTER